MTSAKLLFININVCYEHAWESSKTGLRCVLHQSGGNDMCGKESLASKNVASQQKLKCEWPIALNGWEDGSWDTPQFPQLDSRNPFLELDVMSSDYPCFKEVINIEHNSFNVLTVLFVGTVGIFKASDQRANL